MRDYRVLSRHIRIGAGREGGHLLMTYVDPFDFSRRIASIIPLRIADDSIDSLYTELLQAS
jgi:hypothetical protein